MCIGRNANAEKRKFNSFKLLKIEYKFELANKMEMVVRQPNRKQKYITLNGKEPIE